MLIRRLTPADVAEYRALMLQAYAHEPEAFIATVAEREPLPMDWWLPRVAEGPDAPQRVFGAFLEGELAGVAGLRFEQRPRTRHKARLYGMAVLPAFRGRGVARALVQAVLEEARSHPETRLVQLTVTEANTPARRLYTSCGFRPFGTEPMALRIGERFLAKIHMWCPVDET
ncbi:MAG: GNAT family N-acetyltransferase [Acidobacteriota bacterium]|nr:GNAT family N-acetyltransferase [Acidobacteriota bacterium]